MENKHQEQWNKIQEHFKFSKKQKLVAQLLCNGLTNKAIAKELNLCVPTVGVHITNIFRSMDVNSGRKVISILLNMFHSNVIS